MLFHIAYISKNTIDGDLDVVKNEISDILTSARKNNPSLDITGALLYSGGYFCQVIEGTEEAISKLFETIKSDPRHGDVTVLHYEKIEQRNFANWSMAYAGIDESDKFQLFGLLESKDKIALRETGKRIIETLDRTIKRRQTISSK